MMKSIFKNSFLAASLLAALSSCGKQTFDVVQSQQNSDAPGSVSIAPKVDILVAVDDTGSTAGLQAELQSSIRVFMNELQSQGWNYRLAVVPLTAGTSITAITTSKFDPNWGSEWIAPYPGATSNGVPSVPSNLFVKPEQFSSYVALNTQASGEEPGLQNIGNILNLASTRTNFLRNDAILATVIFSNGDDTSGIPYCYPGTVCAQPTQTLTQLTDKIRNAKGASLASTVRLYSVVNTAGVRVTNCRLADGGVSNAGSRYVSAASMLGGVSYNICSQPLSTVLAGIKTNLQSIVLPFVAKYILLSQRPNESTIKVFKKLANGQSVELPRIASNGAANWEYIGYQNSVPMISEPVLADYRAGYAIHLLGSNSISGSETASVTFLPYGVNPSN